VGEGPELRLLIGGDSSAAGVGVATQAHALAGQLSAALAQRCGARVVWRLVARSGLTSEQAVSVIDVGAAGFAPDIAVLVLGVNDVIDQVRPRCAVAARDRLTNRLRQTHGVRHVVVAPLPPMHRFPGLPQPLRWIAGIDARRHDRAAALWAAQRRRMLGDVSHVPFDQPLERAGMASDGFHPGEPVYRAFCAALAEHIAVQLWPTLQPQSPGDTP
jgi:lysophospholipase L1-like esterase